MSWFRALLLALVPALFAVTASAQVTPLPSCPTPNPNLLAGVAGHPFFPGCPLPADALNRMPVLSGSAPQNGNFAAWVSVPGTSNALQDSNISTTSVTAVQTPSNAAMAALSITGLTSGVSGIYRQGYYNPGDGGAAHYTWSSSVCSLNSGAGDGGSQVRDSTGCWILSPPSGGIDVRVWGAQCGATDSSATLQSAVTYVAANKGGTVLIPCPITLSTGNVSLGNSVHLQGTGPVYWPVQTGLSTADGNPGTSNTWPPSIGPAINCTSATNPCLILAGAGDEIDHINFGNPEPAPPVSGTYAPTAFPFIISSVLGSGWQGAYLHDLTCTSCYNWIDLEGLSSYSSVSLFSGTQLRIQHMWCDPCMGTALRLHDIDNPILEEGWEFTPTGWYFDSGPLGTYLRTNAIGFDITYDAAGQFHDNDFFSLKSAIQYTNGSVTNNFGANTFAQSGAQFNNTMFNQVCQGVTMPGGAATTVVAPTVGFVGVQVWGDQSGNQCSKGKPFFALTSNNFNISMSHVGVWDVDTFASVGCGTPNTGSCPSGSPTLSNAILALDGVDAVSYATWTATAPFIQCVSGAYVGLGISNMAAIRPANSATGTLFGPGLDGSQCSMAPLQVGGGTNAKEGSIQIKGSGDATHSGRAEFYLPNHNRNGYVGASNNLGIDLESDAGQIFLKPDFGTPGGPFASLGVSGAGGSGSNLLLSLNPQPTTPPSGTTGGFECYDSNGVLYACSSGLNTTVASVSALQAITGMSPGTYAIRTDFGAQYVYSVTNCSLNSGAGDGGSQIKPSSTGGCWNIISQPIYDVRIWGAVGNGTGDNTAVLQAAINSNLPLYFAPGNSYRFTSTLTNTSHNGLYWRGANNRTSELLCATVSTDCIQIGGGAEGTSQVYGALLENLYIARDTTVGPTGGNSLNLTSAAQTTVRNVIFDQVCNGIFTDEVNTITLDQVNVTAGGASTCSSYGIKNYSSTSYRSDWIEVIKTNVEMNNATGADAWDVDGWVNTGNVTDVNLLNSAHGFKATNSNHGTGGKYPTFWNFKNVQIDGASINGMDIEAGYNYIIADSYIDNNHTGATGAAVLVNPDTGFSNTNVVTFHHSMIEDSPNTCAAVNALNVTLDANFIYDCNIANNGSDGIVIGANAQWVTIRGNTFGVTAYSVTNMGQNINVISGAKNVIIAPDNNYAGSTTTIGNSATPTVSSCGSGTVIASQSTDLSGLIFIGSGTVTSCILSFAGTYSSSPISITLTGNLTSVGTLAASSQTSSGFTISSAANMAGSEVFYRVNF